MRQGNNTLIVLILIFILSGCKVNRPAFKFHENSEGFELVENGLPVFFYQRKPKSLTGDYVCNNYLHPVYDLKGEILTEEFPVDHPYHRGIFWAWHQIYINNFSVGDGWIMENILQDVIDLDTKLKNKSFEIKIKTLWRSALWENGQAFVEENTVIRVHKKEKNFRKIDFEIVLDPLVSGVQIGGSDDEKGYGGFCIRLSLPESIAFTSENGDIIPQNLQIRSGPWMDFSAYFSNNNDKTGITLICHPSVPNYPSPWILRQKSSMQNIVFPGRARFDLDKPVVLRYRVIIHNGDAGNLNMIEQQDEYNKLYK